MPTTGAEAPFSRQRGDCEISTDPARLDLSAMHGWIANESYWAPGIPRALFDRAVANSLTFGLYRQGAQVGFARVITDRATYGYLCDVWIDRGARGQGLGRWLVECVLGHPDLQGLRRLSLMTRNAHGLYAALGFSPMPDPTRYLERKLDDPYR